MKVFRKYAELYDMFYGDKNYRAEAVYVDRLIKQYNPGARKILDFGCGTGRHDVFFHKKGYAVCGVDSSSTMIEIARKHKADETLTFVYGDIRSVRLKQVFDAIVALFHVISYQLSNDDLMKTFRTARSHLRRGGIFIFDFWYGPAVLTNRPFPRVKKMEKNGLEAIRFAEPFIKPNENIVDVNYRIILKDDSVKRLDEIRELHRIRYLFLPELALMLKIARFSVEKCLRWQSFDKELNSDSWYGVIVARAE